MPETQSQEKKDMLRLCGADLRLVPAVPYANPATTSATPRRLAEEIAAKEPNGAIWANQFDNVANRDGHYQTTGPEIWDADRRQGRRLHLLGRHRRHAGAASAIALKERNPNIKIDLADPMGSALYSWYARGEFKPEGNSITEGIGQGRVTNNLEGVADRRPYQITDEEALPVLFDLVEHEGLVLGGSTGDQHRRRHPARARSWGPARPSSPSSPMAARAISRSCSIPAFLREKNLPVRTG